MKTEVACIAVYNSEAFIVGSKKGISFFDSRKDLQKDFIQYCEYIGTVNVVGWTLKVHIKMPVRCNKVMQIV